MSDIRSNVLDGLITSDGLNALDAALSNGVSESTLRARLRRGLSLDLAVLPVQRKPNAFERGDYSTPFDPTLKHRMSIRMKAFCRKAQSVINAQERLKNAISSGSDPKAAEWLAHREAVFLSSLPEVEEFRRWSYKRDDNRSAFELADKIAAKAENTAPR